MTRKICSALKESFNTIYPIIVIVFVLNLFLNLYFPDLINFLISSIFIIFGITLFSFGINISMINIGKDLGEFLIKNKKVILILLISLIVGIIITIAEPDLILLSTQLSNVPNTTFILIVSLGIGIFLLLSSYRILYKKQINKILIICYSIILLLIMIVPKSFVTIAFDASGATTGAISVPFIMALGIGLVSNRTDKKAKEDSFGMIGLCSVGPIITVLLMGLFYNIENNYQFKINNNSSTLHLFKEGILQYGKEILIALIPITILLIIFQTITKKYDKKQLKKIILGILIIFIGFTLFLTGANIGYLNIAYLIGSKLMISNYYYLLIPLGALIGFFIVQAEPSVKVLTEQVETITGGSISKKLIAVFLSMGVSLAVTMSLIRVTTGISILWFLIPGYFISLLLTYYIPKIFTSIAFDSGGASSGTMTACFLLPLAIGATTAINGNIIEDAFGMVAMVSMAPILTIQLLGYAYKIKKKKSISKMKIDETIINYRWW